MDASLASNTRSWPPEKSEEMNKELQPVEIVSTLLSDQRPETAVTPNDIVLMPHGTTTVKSNQLETPNSEQSCREEEKRNRVPLPQQKFF